MNNKKEQYNKHLNFIFGPKDLDALSENETNECFLRMLSFLPNKGKLYKYRSFESALFNNYYDSIKNGYLWLANAESLNDDLDVVIKYDNKSVKQEIYDSINNNKKKYYKLWLKQSINAGDIPYDIRDVEVDIIVDNYADDMKNFNQNNAILYLNIIAQTEESRAKECIKCIQYYIENISLEDVMEVTAEKFIEFNNEMRRIMYVYSMSASYKLDPMWALYAGNNNGFCIEYDYNKAKNADTFIKKQLLYTFREEYKNREIYYSFKDELDYFLNGKVDESLLRKAQGETFLQCRTKKRDWSFEREWRIMLSNYDNHKLYADLVSKVIIDERSLNNSKAKRLIGLCKRKGISIVIRKIDRNKKRHEYCKMIQE